MEIDEGSTKNQTSSPIGWLHMHIWKMSLQRTKSSIISWEGSFKVGLIFVKSSHDINFAFAWSGEIHYLHQIQIIVLLARCDSGMLTDPETLPIKLFTILYLAPSYIPFFLRNLLGDGSRKFCNIVVSAPTVGRACLELVNHLLHNVMMSKPA